MNSLNLIAGILSIFVAGLTAYLYRHHMFSFIRRIGLKDPVTRLGTGIVLTATGIIIIRGASAVDREIPFIEAWKIQPWINLLAIGMIGFGYWLHCSAVLHPGSQKRWLVVITGLFGIVLAHQLVVR